MKYRFKVLSGTSNKPVADDLSADQKTFSAELLFLSVEWDAKGKLFICRSNNEIDIPLKEKVSSLLSGSIKAERKEESIFDLL